MDFGRYLKRIGFEGDVERSFETLTELHRYHMFSVPFENLDIHLNKKINLDLDRIYEKVVEQNRGGFCYELNGLFAELLRSIGFEVELLNVRVFYDQETLGPDFDHLALLVDKKWLADVGFGDCFLLPLTIEEGVQSLPNGEFRLVSGDEWVLERRKEDAWERQYSFTTEARDFDEFTDMCEFQQTDPKSTFTQKIIVSKSTQDGRISYSNGRKIVTTPEGKTRSPINSEEELREFLETNYGFEISDDYAVLHVKGLEIRSKYSDCPLCATTHCKEYSRDSQRPYFGCKKCGLIFVPPEYQVSIKDELERYLEHNNDETDQGYRDFLSGMIDEITPRISTDKNGLDFGCGPTPVLAKMLRDLGYEIETFDPYFDNRRDVFETSYDFVVSTEVLEHVSNPSKEIRSLVDVLKAQGALFVMTKTYDDSVDFSKWHYKNDKTHITFFRLETFQWIAREFELEYEKLNDTCHLFRKKGAR